jgi:hypothetical protein
MATMEGPAALRPTAAPERHRHAHPVAALAPVGAALALSGLLLMGDDGLSAGEVVRVGLAVAWALAGLALVLRAGQRRLGAVVLAAAALGSAAASCTATSAGRWPPRPRSSAQQRPGCFRPSPCT